MSGQAWAAIGMLLMALVLPLAALRGGRIPPPTAARMATIWLALFILVAMAFSAVRG